ncbi:MAG: hypothetical protein PHF14_05290 [Verrucomicrobiota bacterium]|nr:hypothetical protein [Verrucomicrobiota bacterium]MDD8045858.1 hypothetical protein [Verrucomicrobiota bacterium]MDD8052314.1 hypothetical protein [Verrucomicrobiota bacterium]MDI9384031.1 hypothetical protein [Verrucomicrobiota bacterium]
MADRLTNSRPRPLTARLLNLATLGLWLSAAGLISWHLLVLGGIVAEAGVPSRELPQATETFAWSDSMRLRDSVEIYKRGLPAELISAPGLQQTTGPVLSDLQVTVLGTDLVVQANGAVEEAFAVIRDDRTLNVGVYAVGQNMGDAVLLRIQPNEVLVRREDGRQEILRFLDPASGPAPRALTAPQVTQQSGLEGGRAAQIVFPVNPFRRQINREDALSYIEEVYSDLETLSAYAAGFKPMLQGDQLQGFMLGPSLPKDMLQATGLQPGDIIRRVNSLELDATSKIDYFFDEFTGNRLGAIVLDVERSGVRTNLVYNVK